MLDRLAGNAEFSGAVVIRDAKGVRFARGYGMADPFSGRAFTSDTPADSASLAKPFTAAAVLALAQDGKVDLDAAVRRYLPEYPHPPTTVRQLLSHSGGLVANETAEGVANKSNAALLAEAAAPSFPPGSAFSYCNLCSVALAMLIERVSGISYLDFLKRRIRAPRTLTLRPARLADWQGRAIGHRRTPEGKLEPFDIWEGESFYGPANLSVSALELADWGSRWWRDLAPLRRAATEPAMVLGKSTGLTLGNWYCAPMGRRCHYLGHHEGFHHMLYWDAERRISVAMLSNNALAPGLQQRLQRALVAAANGNPKAAAGELEARLVGSAVPTGHFVLASGERIQIAGEGERRIVRRRGVAYAAFPVGESIRYVPGLDVYLAGTDQGRLRWLSLYEDVEGRPFDVISP